MLNKIGLYLLLFFYVPVSHLCINLRVLLCCHILFLLILLIQCFLCYLSVIVNGYVHFYVDCFFWNFCDILYSCITVLCIFMFIFSVF